MGSTEDGRLAEGVAYSRESQEAEDREKTSIEQAKVTRPYFFLEGNHDL
jgi:hypothetical protein